MPLSSNNVWYAAAGDGPPLVLVHGAGGSHLDWPAELRRIDGVRVIVPDLPGHGRSPGPGHDTISGYVGAVVGLLDALDLDRACIAGHSMGGAIAQHTALEHPQRVAGLILVGTGAKLRVHPDFLKGIRTEQAAITRTIADWMFAPDAPREMVDTGYERLLQTDAAVYYGDLLACDRFDIRDRLGKITAPVLVIGGTQDRMTPHKFSDYLRDNIPNAELVTVDGGGHMMMLEQPGVVGPVVREWLETHPCKD